MLFLSSQAKIESISFDYKLKKTLAKHTLCPITASGSNFKPRNTQCIPMFKVFAFLELEQN